MQVSSVTSASNSLLKRVRSLHQRSNREKQGLFLLEGQTLLAEAIAKNVEIQNVLCSKTYFDTDSSRIPAEFLEEITIVEDNAFIDLVTTKTSCGVVAVAKQKKFHLTDCLKGENTLICVIDAVQDPGNIGTIFRTALAFGVSGIILSKGTVDIYNPKVVRSAMGALFTLPAVTDADLATVFVELKNEGISTVALEPSSPKPFWEVGNKRPAAFIFGNEGNGLSEVSKQNADELVVIPMENTTESLNVAAAVAVVLSECYRHRLSK